MFGVEKKKRGLYAYVLGILNTHTHIHKNILYASKQKKKKKKKKTSSRCVQIITSVSIPACLLKVFRRQEKPLSCSSLTYLLGFVGLGSCSDLLFKIRAKSLPRES